MSEKIKDKKVDEVSGENEEKVDEEIKEELTNEPEETEDQKRIKQLEEEKNALALKVEELVTSVEGLKSDLEKTKKQYKNIFENPPQEENKPIVKEEKGKDLFKDIIDAM